MLYCFSYVLFAYHVLHHTNVLSIQENNETEASGPLDWFRVVPGPLDTPFEKISKHLIPILEGPHSHLYKHYKLTSFSNS